MRYESLAILAAQAKCALDDVRNYGDRFSASHEVVRNSALRNLHDFRHHRRGVLRPLTFLVRAFLRADCVKSEPTDEQDHREGHYKKSISSKHMFSFPRLPLTSRIAPSGLAVSSSRAFHLD